MIEIGKHNRLKIDRKTSPGFYLVDDEGESVLLPTKYCLPDMNIGEIHEVFVYKDNEGRPIATTLTPMATVGEFASLEVKQVNKMGCFLEIGLQKDLLLPFREQRNELEPGDFTVVYIYLDEKSQRMVATEKLNKFISTEITDLKIGDEVEVLIYEESNLGFKAVVNQSYYGMVYHNEMFKEVCVGDELKAFVKQIRPDGKLDLQLEAIGYQQIDGMSKKILDKLKKEGGFLPLHDKTDPDIIKRELEISKKAFKKAIGSLYKNRLIEIEDEGIRLHLSPKSRKK